MKSRTLLNILYFLLVALLILPRSIQGQPCAPTPAGLVSWWRAESNALDSAGGNNGTLQNGATFAAGKVGQAFSLDGVDDVVLVADAPNLRFGPTSPMTVDMWVFRTSSHPAQNLIGKRISCTGSSTEGTFHLFFEDAGSGLAFGSPGGACACSGQDLPFNTWTHVAGTFDGTTLRLFINGQLAATTIGSLGPANTAPLKIGDSGSCGAFYGQAFGGLIDEVSLYNRALTTNEIQAIYDADSAGKCPPPPPCVPSPSGLAHWWSGEGNANDVVGGSHGTLSGGMGFAAGKVGQAFSFDGVNDFVSFGNTAGNFGTNDFTIDFWIKTTSTRHEAIIEKWPVCGYASMFTIRMEGSVGGGRLGAAMFSDNVGNNGGSFVSRPINDGIFHHAALVRQGTNLAFYIDGTLDATSSTPGVTSINNAVNLVAGTSVCGAIDTFNFTGQMDEISIYSRALTADEIQAIYNAGSAGKCPPPPPPPPCTPAPAGLVSWWRAESNALDSAGGNNGTLQNGATFAAGKVGQAFSLDGVDDVVLVADAPNLRFGPTSPMTVDLWVFRTSSHPAQNLIGKRISCTGSSTEGTFHLFFEDAGSGLAFGSPGGACACSGQDLPFNTWTHVAGTFDGTTLRLFINGQLAATTIGSLGPANTAPLKIGDSGSCGAFYGQAFGGLIDEVSLYNRALTTNEIQAIYDADSAGKCPPPPPCVPSPSGLAHWWSGEGNANDVVGGSHGTLSGGMGFAAGKVGQAFSFDGVNDFVSFGNTAGNFGTNDFTIDFWIKTTSTRHEAIIEKWPVCGYASMFTIRMEGSVGGGRLGAAMFSDNVGNNGGSFVSRPINDGIFHHAALVRQGTNLAFYIDGTLDATSSTPGVTSINNAVNLVAGTSVCGAIDTFNFTGQMDEISIYSRALTADEIQAIYNAGSAGKCPPIAPPAVGPFTNGSFELPVQATGSSQAVPPGSTAITGWMVGGSGLLGWVNGPSLGVNPVDGAQHIGFNGGNLPPGLTISQTFSTAIGQTYEVRFNVGRQGPGSGTMSLLAEVRSGSGALLGSLTGVAPGSPGYGAAQTFSFTATTTNSTLTFTDTSSATIAVDVLLDNVSVIPETQCAPPPSGLVSWWRAESNALDSADGNHGTLQNGAMIVAGKVGQAFSFDGVDDVVLVPDAPNLRFGPTSPMTVDLWVFRTSSNPVQHMIGKRISCTGSPTEGTFQMFLDMNTGAGLGFGGPSDACACSGQDLPLNTWTHLAGTFDGTTLRLFINGQLVATTPGTLGPANTAPLKIGDSGSCGAFYGAAFGGLIDEVSIYNRALSTNEIQAIYNAGSAGKCPLGAPPVVGPFTNGSFEVRVVSSGGHNLPSGSTDITAWITGGTGLAAIINGPAAGGVNPVDGAQHVAFGAGNSPANATLSQRFLTSIGQAYTVSFSVGRSGPGGGTMSLLAEAKSSTGAVLGSLTAVAPSTQTYGPPRAFTFTATTTNSTLIFTDTSSATVAVDMLLDNVSVIVVPVNNPPVANSQSLSVNEDTTNAVALTGSDLDGDPLTFIVVSGPTNGTLSGTSSNLTYKPNPNYFGADGFRFKVNDGHVDSAVATVNITVLPVNDPPVANSQSVNVNEDTPVAITLTASDVDGDALTYTVTPPAHGTLSGTAPNLTYKPGANYFGPDGFTFKANDGHVDSAVAVVSINVISVNDAPVARATVSPLAHFPGLTNLVVISPNNTNAPVVLDGSLSTDVENDPLQYTWLEGTNVLATVVVTTNRLNVGTHVITLAVSDGTDFGMDTVSVEVITPAQSVGILIAMVNDAHLLRKYQRPLVAALKASAAAFDDGRFRAGKHRLEAFQNKVRARIVPLDQALADKLINAAQVILDAVITSGPGRDDEDQ